MEHKIEPSQYQNHETVLEAQVQQELGRPKIAQLEELCQTRDKLLVELMAATSECAIVERGMGAGRVCCHCDRQRSSLCCTSHGIRAPRPRIGAT